MRSKHKSASKILSVMLTLAMALGLVPVLPASSVGGTIDLGVSGAGFVSDDNGYIKYYVNEQDGSFYIMPSAQVFDPGKEPSVAMFRIAGETYRFGDLTQSAQGMIPPQKITDGTTQTTWYVRDYAITQYLNIVKEDSREDSYAVYVGYDIRYDGDGKGGIDALDGGDGGGGVIEARLIIDTRFGLDDDQPVLADGYHMYITNETVLSPAPSCYMMDENISGAGPFAYGLLVDDRFIGPETLAFAHFESLTAGGFDYAPRPDIDFSSPNNPYGVSDSAMALEFSIDMAGKNGDAEVVTIGTIYGFSGLSSTVFQPEASQAAQKAAATFREPMQIGALSLSLGFAGDVNDGVDFDALQSGGIYYGVGKPSGIPENDLTPFYWYCMGEETHDGVGDGYLTFLSYYYTEELNFNMTGYPRYADSAIVSHFGALLDPLTGTFLSRAQIEAIPDNYDIVTGYPAEHSNVAYGQKFYLCWGDPDYEKVYWSANDSPDAVFSTQQDNWFNPGDYPPLLNPDSGVGGAPDVNVWWLRTATLYAENVLAYDENRDMITSRTPLTKLGVRPVMKLDPKKIVYYDKDTQIVTVYDGSDTLGVSMTLGAGAPSGLTTVQLEPALGAAANSININITTSLSQAEWDDYSISYKIVGDSVSGRQIVQYGEIPLSLTGAYSFAYTNCEEGTYDFYYWLQKNNDHASNVASYNFPHFELTVERADYAIDKAPGSGCSFDVSPSGPYRSGDTVTISNIIIPDPTANKSQVNVFYDAAGGAKINVPLDYDSAADTYSFIMPPGNVEIWLDAFSKDSTVITVENNLNGNVTLSRYAGLPGDVITVTAHRTKTEYFVKEVQLYLTWSELGEQAIYHEELLAYPYTGTISFADSQTGTFTIPANIGTANILVKIVTEETPRNTVVFPATTSCVYAGVTYSFDVIPDDGANSGWSQSGGKWTTDQYLPGQNATFGVYPADSNWQAVVPVVTHGGVPLDYSTKFTERKDGFWATVVTVAMPPFTTLGNWNATDLNVTLSGRRIYKPYTVTTVTPNAGAFENFSSLTVAGTGFEQIKGQGVDYAILTPEEQATVRTVTFGNSADGSQNRVIPISEIVFNADGTLTIPISRDYREDYLRPNANGTFYLSVGNVTRAVTLDMNYQLRYTPFSVLGIVGGAGTGYRYRIELADNNADLDRRANGDPVLLRIRGTMSYNQSTGAYYFAKGNAMFNSMLIYDVAADNGLSVMASNGNVTIMGSSGKMNLPGFSVNVSMPMRSTILAGTKYSATEVAEENSDFKNISLAWSYDYPDAAELGLRLAAILGMTADIDSIRLLEKSVVFGGKMTVSLPYAVITSGDADNTITGVSIDRLQYGIYDGLAVFQGVEASGWFRLPDNFRFSFLDIDANANAHINTFTNNYSFDANINLHLFEMGGSIEFKPLNGYIIPDGINAHLFADEGVEVIPGILQINGGGGGFRGLADTISRDFTSIPPFMLNTKMRISLIEVVGIDGDVWIGPSGYNYTGALSIGKGGFALPLGTYSYGLGVYDDGLTVSGNVNMTLVDNFQMFTGNASLFVGYRKYNGGLSFSGNLNAKVQIPRFKVIFWYGPITLLNVNCGIDRQGISAKVRVLKMFDIKVWYDWGASKPDFQLFSAPTWPTVGSTLDSTQPMYDENGEYAGTVTIGGNLKLIEHGASGGSGGIIPLSPFESAGIMPLAVSLTDGTATIELDNEYQFVMVGVPRGDLAVFYSTDSGVSYDEPYPLYYPRLSPATDDDPYTEAEINASWVNALDQSCDGEASIMLRLDTEKSFHWMIKDTSGNEFEYAVIEAAPLPEISEASLSGDVLHWKADNLDVSKQYSLDVFLTQDDGTSSGGGAMYPIVMDQMVTAGLAADTGTITLDTALFPDEMQTGDYHALVYLKTYNGLVDMRDGNGDPVYDEDGLTVLQEVDATVEDVKYTVETLRFTNARQPSQVQNFSVAAAGGGSLNASWDKSDGDVYYMITPYDGSGEPMAGDQPYIYHVSPDMYADSTGGIAVCISGLPMGADYKLEIVPFRLTEPGSDKSAAIIMGLPLMSDPVRLPLPDYPDVSASFDSAVLYTDELGNLSVYSSSGYTLHLSADQDCLFTVTENGRDVYQNGSPERTLSLGMPFGSGETTRYVVVTAKNAYGDISFYYYNAYYSDRKPVLFVDTNADGVIFADSSGKFTATGTTNPYAAVSLYMDDPVMVRADEDGSFALTGTLPSGFAAAAVSADSGMLVTIGSTDALGNTETANVMVVPSQGSNDNGDNGGSGGATTTSSVPPTGNDGAKTDLGGGYCVTTPKGQDPVKGDGGELALPGGGKIITPDQHEITVPPGTVIDKSLNVMTPQGSGVIIALSNGLRFNIHDDAVIILDGNVPLGYRIALDNPFMDARASDWFIDCVMFAYEHGLMVGTSTKPMLFGPNMTATRGMIVTILYRMAGNPDVSGLANPFSDVAGEKWYADAVIWAAANGIVSGYGDGLYGPDDSITREQLAAILNNYLAYAGLSLPDKTEYAGFNDDADIANYAAEAIEKFFKSGIIAGKPGGIFDPKGNATRAEVATMLMRLIEAATE